MSQDAMQNNTVSLNLEKERLEKESPLNSVKPFEKGKSITTEIKLLETIVVMHTISSEDKEEEKDINVCNEIIEEQWLHVKEAPKQLVEE
eukprot:5956501-Ditylum_brightwellii.AAC.1